jgi:hypothetical protein
VRNFLRDELRRQIGVSYNAAAVMEVLAVFRIWFHLPPPVVAALKKDARKKHLLRYLQTQHRRYEDLSGLRSK